MSDIGTSVEGSDEEYPKSGPVDRAINGPLDESEAGAIRPSIDLGSLRIEPKRGMQLRLEIDKSNDRVIAVTLEHDGSSVQLQPFAAPRSSGLWHGIRAQIMDQIVIRFSMLNPDGKYHIPVIISPNSYSVWWSGE